MSIEKINEIAKRKCGNIENWEPYKWSIIKGGVLVQGCLTRKKMRGKNKGDLMYLVKCRNMTTVVTREEQNNE